MHKPTKMNKRSTTTWFQSLFTVLCLVLLSVSNSVAQNVNSTYRLILQNHEKDKTVEVLDNRKMKIWLTDGIQSDPYGEYQVVDDRTIAVDGKNYLLTQIKKIRVSQSAIQTLGVAAFGAGISIFPFGVGASLIDGGIYLKSIGLPIVLASTGLIAVGAMATFKRYNFKLGVNDWKLAVEER